MARIEFGIAMSHSPMMALEGKSWIKFAERDYHHPNLWDHNGNKVTYDELVELVNAKYEDEAKAEVLEEKYDLMVKNFKRLYEVFQKHQPDVVVVIGNDHPGEWFTETNVPALAVYTGEKMISAKINTKFSTRNKLSEEMAIRMGMDDHHVWPVSEPVSRQLITALMDHNFDVAVLREQEDPSERGHGHGYGFVVTHLMKDKLVPMVPIYLNTWPPNIISPSRCYDLGIVIRKAIEAIPDNLKVGVIASGGLSHFVTDVEIDQYILKALKERDEQALRNVPKHKLHAGSSEIRNWVVMEAAIRHLDLIWYDYIPVFRTPGGTGIGMGFAYWE